MSSFNKGRKTVKKLRILKCKRCGYEWVPRISGQPRRCANCKSMYWDSDYQFSEETIKKVSDYQRKRWRKIRRENGQKKQG